MNLFVKKTLQFLFISYLVSLLLDVVITKSLKLSGELTCWKDIAEDNVKADILIFGSSRCLKHFNTKIIKDSTHLDAYNLGGIGNRIEIAYIKLLEYLNHSSHKAKYITLEVDYLTVDNSKQIPNHWQLIPYLLYNTKYKTLLKDYDGFYDFYYYIPLARYGQYFSTLIKNSTLCVEPNIYNGYFPNCRYWDENNLNYSLTISINKKRDQILNEFISKCQENNISVNLVYTPEHIAATQIVKNKEVITEYLNNIAKRNNIEFANFSECSLCNDTSLFHNVRHLNNLGADKFTAEYYVPWIKELYGL